VDLTTAIKQASAATKQHEGTGKKPEAGKKPDGGNRADESRKATDKRTSPGSHTDASKSAHHSSTHSDDAKRPRLAEDRTTASEPKKQPAPSKSSSASSTMVSGSNADPSHKTHVTKSGSIWTTPYLGPPIPKITAEKFAEAVSHAQTAASNSAATTSAGKQIPANKWIAPKPLSPSDLTFRRYNQNTNMPVQYFPPSLDPRDSRRWMPVLGCDTPSQFERIVRGVRLGGATRLPDFAVKFKTEH
jgi:hypothetical protein